MRDNPCGTDIIHYIFERPGTLYGQARNSMQPTTNLCVFLKAVTSPFQAFPGRPGQACHAAHKYIGMCVLGDCFHSVARLGVQCSPELFSFACFTKKVRLLEQTIHSMLPRRNHCVLNYTRSSSVARLSIRVSESYITLRPGISSMTMPSWHSTGSEYSEVCL